jgi:maltose phosphorylase
MIKYLHTDPWKIIQKGFDPKHQKSSESIFSLGNGKFGQRANHEEGYSGDTLMGHYVAGVYYPDKTRVGWWKNGYPEYFAKVLNSTNWTSIPIWINGEELDLARVHPTEFCRELNMQTGVLTRRFQVDMRGVKVECTAQRFISMARESVAALRYEIKIIQGKAEIVASPRLEGLVINHDSNYDELFWTTVETEVEAGRGVVVTRTKKTEFELAVAMECNLLNWHHLSNGTEDGSVETRYGITAQTGDVVVVEKFIGLQNSLYTTANHVKSEAVQAAQEAKNAGYTTLLQEHELAWQNIWELADIVIEGNDEAQQGIRFNIFHLNQTYTGSDPRLNIGPKGFTGEKYGGSTYWDTEAYCIPFYLATKSQTVARQLLKYRYHHLPKAIENAEKLGFNNGAALYPMVTMNGEECHNEWEITFEEIHRNGAIAYAIYQYALYTGDQEYVHEFGLPVLVGISRFWAQRVHFSQPKQQYVMHGVTGPNEYENNVNNNWYTNYIATWCMRYTLEVWEALKSSDSKAYADQVSALHWETQEAERWQDIIKRMHFPQMPDSPIRLQQDGFLDKDIKPASDIPESERPINQHWSWDRILRSCFIKQADVLQGMFFFEHEFTEDEIRANFDFYEPMTVHESSLSPCVHSILAARLGKEEKAVEMYMRTSRLDLDDYNHEAHEGLHITSMAGTWMSVVHGFGGMRVRNGEIQFNPMIPQAWKSYTFHVMFDGCKHEVHVNHEGSKVKIHC